MCLTVTQGIEKKDILALRKSSERQACNSSNWLLWWEFKFFSKREAAILGAGVRGTRNKASQGSALSLPEILEHGWGGGWEGTALG